MKNAGICRRALTPAAVLMAMAVSAFDPARATEDRPAPDALAFAMTIVSANPVESLQSVPEPKIFGARHYRDYTQEYAETTYKLPLASGKRKSLVGLGENQDQATVFFCNGNSGNVSIPTAQIASSRGERTSIRFRGGLIEWRDKDYPHVIG